ncbi:hypothetical protein CRUP_027404 [Coryphaenoides rupestris]|nr:hypothetical protein CRUP_027404 [Coryphaenoides rupestris]
MVGFGPEDDHFVAELTYNYGVGEYHLGNDFQAAPLLTILDMSARAKYVRDVEEITQAVVDQFVGDFLAEKLKPEPI